jgi:hypothetical protein
MTLCAPTTASAARAGANHRNGDRDWQTPAGAVERRIPKLRRGIYFPGFL